MDYTEYAMYYGPEAANRAAYDALYSNGSHLNQDAWARIWADDATRYGSATDREARDLRNWFTDKPPTPRTITLQPGEYQWTNAPKLRFSPDTYADIVRALGQFESRYLRPTRIEANLATIQALAEVFTPGVEVERDRPQMTIFGIPFAIADGVPTGVLRIRNMGATRDVALREAPSANYVKKG